MIPRCVFPRLLVAVLIGYAPPRTSGQDAPEALKDLESAIRKDLAAKKPDNERPGRYGEGMSMGPMILGQLRTALGRDEPSLSEETLNQITAYFPSEAIGIAVAKLRTAWRTEREAKDKAFIAEIDSALAATAKAVQSATKAADLDNVLRDLGRFQDRRDERVSEKARAEQEKVRIARQFLIHWQDYLANLEAGNQQQAIQNLQSASNANAEMFLPRSAILSTIKKVSDKQTASPSDRVPEIMGKVKSLDDIANAISALDKIRFQPGTTLDDPQNVVTALSTLLGSIQHTYQSYKAGVPTDMAITLKKINGFPVNGEAESLALPLRERLMRLVFPRFLGIDDKPNPEETIQAYLNRIMADASAHLNARLMGRVFELLNRLDGKNDPAPAALQMLVTAQNQDEAEQFMLAVITYQTALKTGGDLMPTRAIGARLNAIKVTHPAEFERGMEKFVAAPETTPAQRQDTYGDMFGTYVRVPGVVPTNP